MEESGFIEAEMNKKTETYKRKMIKVYALIGLLVFFSAAALVYFYNSSNSENGIGVVGSKVIREKPTETGEISQRSNTTNEGNIENEDISLRSTNVGNNLNDHESADGGTSLGSNSIENDTPEPKYQFFFDRAELSNEHLKIIRLNEDGGFSERFTINFPKGTDNYLAKSQISQSTGTICMAVGRETDLQVYMADLKTKSVETVLTTPYNRDRDGIPRFHFSPDCKSFAYYFQTKDKSDKYFGNKAKVVLRNFKTKGYLELDLGLDKNADIVLRNEGRIIKTTRIENKIAVEVSLFSNDNDYTEEKLFSYNISNEDVIQVSDDASRIVYRGLNESYKENGFLFDVSTKELVSIAQNIDNSSMISMSSDGERVAFAYNIDDKTMKVEIFDAKTGMNATEFDLDGLHRLDYWSANDKFIVFDHSELKKLSISDKSFELVKDNHAKPLWVSLE